MQNKLSQMKLAKLIGVSDVAVLYWEHDKSEPCYEYLCKLCKIFDVTSDYLLGLTDNPY